MQKSTLLTKFKLLPRIEPDHLPTINSHKTDKEISPVLLQFKSQTLQFPTVINVKAIFTQFSHQSEQY